MTTTPEQRREWLALLEEELRRRAARVEWQAGEGERQRQWFIETLQAMAQRLGATAHLYPLDLDDMSIAEKLACHLLPDELRPASLPTEDQIWAQFEALKRG
jgi:hypothetical protein